MSKTEKLILFGEISVLVLVLAAVAYYARKIFLVRQRTKNRKYNLFEKAPLNDNEKKFIRRWIFSIPTVIAGAVT